jgi:predicted dehydrogenase
MSSHLLRPLPPTRRRVLAGAALAAGLPAASSTIGACAAIGARPSGWEPEVLRVGLIGCGGRGTGAALQALNAEPGTVVLTAVGDMLADRVESCLAGLAQSLPPENAGRLQVTPEHAFVGFDAYQRVIDSGVDVVLLCTPPHFRPAHLEAAVAAGKHVFCEKPMAVDAPGLRRVMVAAEDARVRKLALVAGFCWRYNARHREIYARIHDGAMGDVQTVYTNYNTGTIFGHARQPEWTEMEFQLRNWHHFLWLSGDHLVEQACHSLDMQSWLFADEPPLSVTAVGGRQARSGESSGNIYDHFGACFEYSGGRRAFHMSRQIDGCSNENTTYAWGTEGCATINGWVPTHVIEGRRPWSCVHPGNDMYQAEHDELFASIRARKPIWDGRWMCRSTALALMARMAAYTGQTVTWEQCLASTESLAPSSYAIDGVPPVTPVPTPGKTPLT